MQDVITDTHIWYNIETGVIKTDALFDVRLIVHYLTINELIFTDKVRRKPELIRRVINTILSYKNQVLFLNHPYFHIRNLYLVDPYVEDASSIKHIGIFNALGRGVTLTGERSEAFRLRMEGSMNFKERATASENRDALVIKQSFPNLNKIRKKDYTSEFRDRIIQEMGAGPWKALIEIDGPHWKKLELFEAAFKMFQIKIRTGEYVMEVNDWNDLYQLVYVQPGSLYWTRENRWKKIIADSEMGHYLYEK
jgi:hypothetical protein